MTIYESFVSSLTSHLATAQPGSVLHHILTVVGEGRAIKALWNPTDGIWSRRSLNAAITICGNWIVIFIKKDGKCQEPDSVWLDNRQCLNNHHWGEHSQFNCICVLVVTSEQISHNMMQLTKYNVAAHRTWYIYSAVASCIVHYSVSKCDLFNDLFNYLAFQLDTALNSWEDRKGIHFIFAITSLFDGFLA